MKNTELASKDLNALNTELTELLKTGLSSVCKKALSNSQIPANWVKISATSLALKLLLPKNLHRNKEKGI